MAKKRLIDANRALEIVRDQRIAHPNAYPLTNYATLILQEAPTVDAVEVADMKEFAEDVVHQFGYYCQNKGRLHITHGGLSTLEWAFDILGWENPHPVPEYECEIDGCHEHATCGTPTDDGYKRVCSKHCGERRTDG